MLKCCQPSAKISSVFTLTLQLWLIGRLACKSSCTVLQKHGGLRRKRPPTNTRTMLWICFCTFTCCTLCALFVISHRFKCHCSLFVGSFCCHQTNKRAHCYSISGWKISMLLESFPPLLGVLKSTKLLTINYVPPWTPSGTNESIQFADCVPRWWTVPYIITTKQKKQKKKSRHGAHNGFCLVLGWLSPLVSWMRWSSFKAPRLNPA